MLQVILLVKGFELTGRFGDIAIQMFLDWFKDIVTGVVLSTDFDTGLDVILAVLFYSIPVTVFRAGFDTILDAIFYAILNFWFNSPN